MPLQLNLPPELPLSLFLRESLTLPSSLSRDVEAIDRFRLGGWDSYWYLNYKMEAEAQAEAVEAA